MVTLRSSRSGLVGLIGLLALTGCSLSPSGPSNGIPHLKGIGGNIRGGQQPVSGATIQLYTVGTTGDGSAATPMLTSTVTSDANGYFQFGGLFSCTNATLVYLTATGGDPGLGTNNPNLLMMTAIGPCTSITANTFVMIDERTTAAAVSALASFMGASGSPANIGSSPTDVSALTAAFRLSSELVDPSTGETPGQNVPTGMTVPSAEINTLADVLSTCINSAGGVAGDSSACGNLFSLTTPTNGTAPTNTIAALLNVASDPTLNTTAIYNLAPGTGAPFQPELTTVPPDFQVRLTPPASAMTLQFNPTSVTFPATPVGFAAAPISVTVTNASSAAVTISSIGLVGPNAADFAETNSTCAATVYPYSTCSLQVTITPSAVGTRTAYLSFVSNASDSPQYLALTGSGVAATAGPITVSPTPLPTFTLAGSSQDITLSNLGSTPLTISSITSSDPTFLPTSNCGTMLAAQSVCTITVESIGFETLVSPSVFKTYNGTLTIDDDASTGPQSVQLQSTNTAQVTNSNSNNPHSFDLGVWGLGDSASQTFLYGTNGHTAGTFSGSFTGPAASDFSTSNSCSVVPTQGSCSFTVTFAPSAVGVRTASLNGVIFTGTGQAAGPSFIGSAGPSTFILNNTNVANGTGTVAVTNNGTTPLNFSFAFSGINASNFNAQSPGCTSLAPTANCSVNYGFTANGAGTYSAVMTITDTNSSISQAIPVTVIVTYWGVSYSPAGLQFAAEPLGVTSAAQTVTIFEASGTMQPLGHPVSVSLQASSNFTLPQGASCPASTTQVCTLSVAFDPHQTGSISEFLTITDLTSGEIVKMDLSGTGGLPAVSLSSSSVTFPARAVGTTSIPTTVTLTNTGSSLLAVSQINMVGAVNGNFTETNNCTTVPANGTCSINVTFAPTAAGAQSATIQILSNAVSSPDSIAVSGTTD